MKKKEIIELAPYALEHGFSADEAWNWLGALEEGFDIGFIRNDGVYPLRDQGVLFDVGNLTYNGTLDKISESDKDDFICIIYRSKIIAIRDRENVSQEWIRQEIQNYKIEEGLLSHKARRIIKTIRGVLWLFPFLIWALLIKILFEQDIVDFSFENLLALATILGAILVMALLYKSREEDNLRKQVKNTFTIIIGIAILYSFCCLLIYLAHDEWVLPYLWF
jgi:hypothetical protein